MTTEQIARERGTIPLPSKWSLFRADTRAIVGGVLLAVCFSANMQITERIDTAVTGGVWPPLGIIFQTVWFSAATYWFGMVSGLIAAWFNPVVAILTATGPLAPAWFGTNGSFAITFAILQRFWLSNYDRVPFWPFWWAVWISNIGTGVVLAAVHIFLLDFDWYVVLAFFIGNQILTSVGATLSWYFNRYIGRSGIVE